MQNPAPLVLLLALAACGGDHRAPGSAADSVSHQVQASVVARADTDTVALRIQRDSLRLAAESATVKADSARTDTLHGDSASVARRKRRLAADSVVWPTDRPAPLPGSMFPAHRIVAFYGNPLYKRMGILG